jgi:hypothetical protein
VIPPSKVPKISEPSSSPNHRIYFVRLFFCCLVQIMALRWFYSLCKGSYRLCELDLGNVCIQRNVLLESPSALYVYKKSSPGVGFKITWRSLNARLCDSLCYQELIIMVRLGSKIAWRSLNTRIWDSLCYQELIIMVIHGSKITWCSLNARICDSLCYRELIIMMRLALSLRSLKKIITAINS